MQRRKKRYKEDAGNESEYKEEIGIFKTAVEDAIHTGRNVTKIADIIKAVERGDSDENIKKMIHSIKRTQERKGQSK